jgi:hypothetical protein
LPVDIPPNLREVHRPLASVEVSADIAHTTELLIGGELVAGAGA